MTVKELSQLYWLNKEIEMNQKRLEELRAKKDSLSSPDFSGVSRGGDGTSRVEWLAVEISDLEKLIQKKQQQCILEHKRLERYIAKIPDSLTRQIFTLRFVNGLKWFQVAMVMGGDLTGDSVRMRAIRSMDWERKQKRKSQSNRPRLKIS